MHRSKTAGRAAEFITGRHKNKKENRDVHCGSVGLNLKRGVDD